MKIDRDAIEHQAEHDLAQTGQTQPPYRPSLVLRNAGVRIERSRWELADTANTLLIPGPEPTVKVSAVLGDAQARYQVAHEAGHVSRGHIDVTALFAPYAGFKGRTLPQDLEREADLYAAAFTMPRSELESLFLDRSQNFQTLVKRYDIPKSKVKRRLQDLDLWRLTYDLSSPEAYRNSGWWTITRRPLYLSDLAKRQGRGSREPLCENHNCQRIARYVHHLIYQTRGSEDDDDLEGLCQQHAYEQHERYAA